MFKRILLAGAIVAGVAFAQRGGGGMGGGGDEMGGMGGGGGRGGDMGGMGSAMPRKASKAEQFIDKLKLSKEQQQEAEKILSAAMERASALRNDMAERRAKIAGAMIDGKPDEETAKLKAEYSEVAAQYTKVQADAFGKIWAMLKPNQQSKGEQAFELLAAIFNTPAGGRGRGGAGMPAGMGSGMGTGRGRGTGR
jgi:hypothetical protein